MDIRKLQRAIVDGLEDVKAQHIVVFNTEQLSPLFERVIIATGASNRQTKALASSVRETVKARGMQVLRTEGEDNGEWIIVDCGAAVAHIMQPGIRDYYHLEEIWGAKAVKMKIGGPAPSAARRAASTVDAEPEPEAPAAKNASRAKTPARKAAAKKPAPAETSKKAPARKTSAKTAASSSGRTAPAAPRKAPARAAAPAGKTVAKPAAKTAAKTGAKPAARKPAAPRRAG